MQVLGPTVVKSQMVVTSMVKAPEAKRQIVTLPNCVCNQPTGSLEASVVLAILASPVILAYNVDAIVFTPFLALQWTIICLLFSRHLYVQSASFFMASPNASRSLVGKLLYSVVASSLNPVPPFSGPSISTGAAPLHAYTS